MQRVRRAFATFQTERAGSSRTYLFVSAPEPLAAAEAAWSAPTPIDLCVTGRVVEEPLLATRRPHKTDIDVAGRHADALRALYALDTRSALVVWDQIAPRAQSPLLFDETWLLHTAELIERHLPLP